MIFSTDSLKYEIDSAAGTLWIQTEEKRVLEAASLIFCAVPSCDWHSLLLMSETDVPH